MQKSFIKLLSRLFPDQLVNYAYYQLTHPQVKKLRPHELEILNTARKETFSYAEFDIQLYHWKGDGNRVLLIHGWEGQAGNFADIIERLRKENFDIYTFDAPSHGFSSTGETSLFEFTELVGVLIRKFKTSKLISHSFGGVATTYALYNNQDIRIDSYVLLTTPDSFRQRVNDVAYQVGITEKVKNRLIERLEEETGFSIDTLAVSKFVPKIQVRNSLIIHDKNDKVIPIERSRNVHQNWPNCQFEEITGTGHFRILRTEFVIDRLLEFLRY